MQLKNNISNIWRVIEKEFLMRFSICSFLILFIVNIFNLKLGSVNQTSIFYSELIFLFITAVLWLKRKNKESAVSKFMSKFHIQIFLGILGLIFIINLITVFNPLKFSSNPIHLMLFLSAIFFGIYTFIHENPSPAEQGYVLGKRLSLLLLLLIIIGVGFLYFYNLGNYGFQMDEFYHAQEIKTFLNTHKLFYVNDMPYGRSKLTTLLALGFHYVFSLFSNNFSEEFIFRLPMVLLGLLNIYIVYLIARKISNRTVALFTAAFFGVETYITYFATYLRFYSPSITIILTLLYWNLKNKKRTIALFSAGISFACYFLLTEYFLVITAFFLGIYGINLFLNRKNAQKFEKSLAFVSIGLLSAGIISVLIYRLNSNSTYTLLAWDFNKEKTIAMAKWLFFNYGVLIIIFIASIVRMILKLKKEKTINLSGSNFITSYVLFNLVFLFIYVVNIKFTFTFRVALFVLPSLFVISFNNLSDVIKNKKVLYTIFLVFIGTNVYFSIRYHLNNTGDYYYPSKPVYEKIDIVTGNKDIGMFLNHTLPQNTTNFVIGYVGLGVQNISAYLDPVFSDIQITNFKYSSQGNSTLEELENYILINKNKDVYLIINANAMSELGNPLQQLVYNKFNSLEANPRLAKYIEGDIEFQKIYTSQDNFSSVYIKKKNI